MLSMAMSPVIRFATAMSCVNLLSSAMSSVSMLCCVNYFTGRKQTFTPPRKVFCMFGHVYSQGTKVE